MADNRNPQYTPVLGLSDDAPPNVTERAASVEATESPAPLELSVIVPARNEEANLARCMESLVVQQDDHFRLGMQWEILVIDDGSTDRTRQIADGFSGKSEGIRVLTAPALETKVATGKSAACWMGAQQSQGRWLLFTDADTVHEARSLIHALYEARKHEAAMLSYSPRQIVSGFWQRALMPLVFSELASVYPMKEVNDPAQKLAAANGQFLLVERSAYFAVGGHRAVMSSVLEDVELADRVKAAAGRLGGKGLRFRYAPDAVATRMYAGVADMLEGWRKNLYLLFPHALMLAAWRLLDIALLLLPVLLVLLPYLVFWQQAAIVVLWLRTVFRYLFRVRRSNFGWSDCVLSVTALPLFIWLLTASWMDHRIYHRVRWKGREYRA